MSKRIKIELVGLDKTIKELARRGELVEAVLGAAAQAGAQIVQAAANRDAPGPGVETEANAKLSKTAYKVVDIGPRQDKWYYRFFETGVSPFEINMITKRTTRTGGGGRPIHSDAMGLAFDVDGERIVTPIVHRGGIPARPFLRPAMDSQKAPVIQRVGSVIKSKGKL